MPKLRNNEIQRIQLTAPKQRAHRALFDENLPFRGRREEDKTAYRRKPKNRRFYDYD